MSLERKGNVENVKKVVESYLLLGNKFRNPPRVDLKLRSQSIDGLPDSARDIAVTTAVQCYSPGIAVLKDRSDEKSVGIEESTLDAGHHTTRMHTNYTWQIVGASRSVVHDVFHNYPFYNSEQQSQRYVQAKEGNYLLPADLSVTQETFFKEAASFSNSAYFHLFGALRHSVEGRVKEMYPSAGWRVASTKERLDKKIDKICQEVARYVLPIGQLTTYFHTLNEVSLLRLFRASQQDNFTDEARFIVGSMVWRVSKEDQTIFNELSLPLEKYYETDVNEKYIAQQKLRFDEVLGGNSSLILNPWGVNEGVLIDGVRNILSLPESVYSDKDVLKLLMDPANNKFLADVYETGMLDPLTSVLRQVSVTFESKFSHTGDSQRQRQRMTPGATPPIEMIYDGNPDCITPLVIKEDPVLKDIYDQIINRIYGDVARAIEIGISKEYALLLLPNATAVRVVESGSLFDWLHRWKQRLCYLAQEEIFFVSVEQVSQLAERMPQAAPMLLAPCGIRQASGISPRCPEGDRWCGQPVFNWKIENYRKHRLI